MTTAASATAICISTAMGDITLRLRRDAAPTTATHMCELVGRGVRPPLRDWCSLVLGGSVLGVRGARGWLFRAPASRSCRTCVAARSPCCPHGRATCTCTHRLSSHGVVVLCHVRRCGGDRRHARDQLFNSNCSFYRSDFVIQVHIPCSPGWRDQSQSNERAPWWWWWLCGEGGRLTGGRWTLRDGAGIPALCGP